MKFKALLQLTILALLFSCKKENSTKDEYSGGNLQDPARRGVAPSGREIFHNEKRHDQDIAKKNGKTASHENGVKNKDREDNHEEPDKSWLGEYSIKTLAISHNDQKEFTIRYYITIDSPFGAVLSIGAENPEDYQCEGDYSLTVSGQELIAKGKCSEDDTNDFYLKHTGGKYYIRSKRFIDFGWKELIKK